MRSQLLDGAFKLTSTPTATNFWAEDSDGVGDFVTTAAQRRDRMAAHVWAVQGGDIVFVGEAAGWRGARQSGVAFTSAEAVGLTGTREATATTVHAVLDELGLRDRALLWNAFPLHPHDAGDPRSNRTPTNPELRSAYRVLSLAVEGRRIVCVGQKAAGSVQALLGLRAPAAVDATAVERAVTVRHPSNGGTGAFRRHMQTLSSLWNL